MRIENIYTWDHANTLKNTADHEVRMWVAGAENPPAALNFLERCWPVKRIGQGSCKTVYACSDEKRAVALTCGSYQLKREVEGLKKLSSLGVPTIPVLGVYLDDRFGVLVMERIFPPRTLLNRMTAFPDLPLDKRRNLAEQGRSILELLRGWRVHDLQVMITQDWKIVVHDPYSVYPDHSPFSCRFMTCFDLRDHVIDLREA